MNAEISIKKLVSMKQLELPPIRGPGSRIKEHSIKCVNLTSVSPKKIKFPRVSRSTEKLKKIMYHAQRGSLGNLVQNVKKLYPDIFTESMKQNILNAEISDKNKVDIDNELRKILETYFLCFNNCEKA